MVPALVVVLCCLWRCLFLLFWLFIQNKYEYYSGINPEELQTTQCACYCVIMIILLFYCSYTLLLLLLFVTLGLFCLIFF